MAPLGTVRVHGTWTDAQQNPLSGTVTLTPAVPVASPLADILIAQVSLQADLDSAGYWSAEVIRSDDPGLSGPMPYRLTVSTSGGSQSMIISVTGETDLADVAPVLAPPSVDPVYLLAASLGVSVAPLVEGTVPVEHLPPGSGGGVTDHGDLTGLPDDDHQQYLTQARGDARYYTEAEVDTALAGKAAVSHAHSGADLTSGTIAIGRIPLGSTAGTVAVGDDARLSDARTPTAHAASHATAGPDPVTPAAIGAALAGHTHPGARVTASPDGSPPVGPAVGDVWVVT